MGEKPPFFLKKKAGKHKNHPTTAIATGGGEACSLHILGTSGTGKAMEPWREGCFLYSLPADGGNNVRQMAEITWSTLIMTANKKCNLPFGLWQAVSKNDYIAAGATGYEAQASDTT